MLKRTTMLLLLAFCFTSLLSAQVNLKKEHKVVDKEVAAMTAKSLAPSNDVLAANAILIGKAWNAYTTQASFTNQIYFDPYSSLLAIIKRNDKTGAGSGRIVYQVSDDMGQNWTEQIGPMNEPFGFIAGRHPNVVIANPTKTDNVEEVAVVGAWAELGATWRYLALSGDAPGAGEFSFHVDSVFAPADEMFVGANGSVFVPAGLQEYDSISVDKKVNTYLLKSDDKGATWSKEILSYESDFFEDTFNGMKGDINHAGNGFIMVQGQAPSMNGEIYTFGLKATSDDGATFANEWAWADWREAAIDGGKLGDKVHGLSYECDFITYTTAGKTAASAFFAGTFTDTVGSNTGVYVIDNQTGSWRATKIAALNTTGIDLAGGLNTLNEIEFARSVDGSVLAVKYADLPSATATKYDLYVSWYNGATWTSAVNITETPDESEVYSQTAPILYKNGDDYQLFTMYTQFGLDPTSGEPSDVEECSFYLLDGVTATVVADVEDNVGTVASFKLDQNYPNPFNPTTTISYTLPEKGIASIKVYDVLGKEVATLLNGIQEAGSNKVKFDASNLASGLYIYKIQAGQYTASKKMMLIK